MEMKSRFSNIPPVEGNAIFKTLKSYELCTNENKINLCIGALQDENGNLLSFNSVLKAEKEIHEAKLDKEYSPIGGRLEFIATIQDLFFPKDFDVVKEGRLVIVQAITGGTALRMSAEIIYKFFPRKIHLSNLTWSPYKNLFANLEICYYPYYNRETQKLDVEAFLNYLYQIDQGSIINLQLSSHNPTALDFTQEDWDRIGEVMKYQHHLAFFDVAYLGYGNGTIEEDLYPIHHFAQNKIEMVISYSSGKNFANYSDCIGALIIVCNRSEPVMLLKSHLIVISRSIFSFIGIYGTRIIEKVLNDPELKSELIQEQKQVVNRIRNLRSLVIEEIEKQEVNINLNFLKSQSGIYMFLDLSDEQVETLAEQYGIYLWEGGRVNLSGLLTEKISYFVACLKNVLNKN